MLNRIPLISLACLALFMASALTADTVVLSNGTSLTGTVIAQDAKTIRLKTRNGERVIQKSTIRRITYGSKLTPAEEAEQEKLEQEKIEKEKAEREKQEAEKKDDLEKLRTENESLRTELSNRIDQKKQFEDSQAERLYRAGWPSMWRSFLIPGWGQYYRGDHPRGIAFMTTAGLSTYYYYRLNKEYQKTRDRFRNAQELAITALPTGGSIALFSTFALANAQRNEMHRAALKVNFVAAVLASTYVFSAADAIFFRGESKRSLSELILPDTISQPVSFSFTLPIN